MQCFRLCKCVMQVLKITSNLFLHGLRLLCNALGCVSALCNRLSGCTFNLAKFGAVVERFYKNCRAGCFNTCIEQLTQPMHS